MAKKLPGKAYISHTHATNPLQRLCDRVDAQNEEIEQQDYNIILLSSDDESESQSPIIDSFVETGGATAILQMTNFAVKQFN